jgi:hypothetical protein
MTGDGNSLQFNMSVKNIFRALIAVPHEHYWSWKQERFGWPLLA